MRDGKQEQLRVLEFVAKFVFEGEQGIVDEDVVRYEWEESRLLYVMDM